MYSKNDYRYYLENRLMHSDDFLAHYGVKGMKWHKKHEGYSDDKYNHEVTFNSLTSNNPRTFTVYGQNQKKKDMRADRRQLHKHVNETNRYSIDKTKSIKGNIKSNVQVAKDRKNLKAIADKTVERYYNGSSSEKKKKISGLRKKYGLYRETPKGTKIKGSKNIYVSHD